VGHDRDREAVHRAESAKAIDRSDWNLPRACEGAAAIFICVPRDELETTLRAIADDLTPNTLVATVGIPSVFAHRIAGQRLATAVPFFSTALIYHPDRINSFETLPDGESVRDAIWAIAPNQQASPAMVDIFFALANQLGTRPLFVDLLEQDGMALAMQVMPVVLSSLFILAVSSDAGWRERMWMAGAEFGQSVQSVQRAVSLAPTLSDQPEMVVHWLNQIMRQCIVLRDAIEQGDNQLITTLFTQAEARRQEWLSAWRKGRTEERASIERDQGGLLKLFLGERLANQLGSGKVR